MWAVKQMRADTRTFSSTPSETADSYSSSQGSAPIRMVTQNPKHYCWLLIQPSAWHPFDLFNPWSEIKSVSSVKSVGAILPFARQLPHFFSFPVSIHVISTIISQKFRSKVLCNWKSLYICNWIVSKSISSGITARPADKQTFLASAHAEPLAKWKLRDKEMGG